MDSQKLEQNSNWKGGRTVKNGYILIRKANHPKSLSNGYVPEHILKMEKRIGRKLRNGEIVHHKNEKKKDNRLSNLKLENTIKHKSEHAIAQMKRQRRRRKK